MFILIMEEEVVAKFQQSKKNFMILLVIKIMFQILYISLTHHSNIFFSLSVSFMTDLGGYFPHAYSDFGCALAMLKESLCAGVTSVRELGGFFGQGLRPLVDSGMYPAPHFHYGSKAIGMVTSPKITMSFFFKSFPI